MGTREPHRSTLNEMLFENRNKSYGAYVIRRDYDLSLIKSFVIAMLFIASLIASFQLLPKTQIEIPAPLDPVKIIETTCILHPLTKTQPKTAVQHPRTTPPVHHDSAPVVVDHDTKHDSIKAEEKPNESPEPAGTGTGPTNNPDPGPGLVETSPPAGPIDIPEVNPEFPGGEKKLLEYLRTHIQYPREAIRQEVSGTVMMRFVVGTAGEIKQIEFVTKIGAGCEAEAKRVVESMPRWKPGMMKGKPVEVYFYLPVSYRLQ